MRVKGPVRVAVGLLMASFFGWHVACTPLGTLTFVSATDLDLDSERIGPVVSGQDCIRSVLIVIPIDGFQPSLEDAINDALSKAPGADLLTDVNVSLYIFDLLLFTEECLKVYGRPEALR